MKKLIGALVAWLAFAAQPALAKTLDCDSVQSIPEAALTLFGEIHGTYESPAVVAEHVCALSIAKPVVVFLEIPSAEQSNIDVYLNSAGRKADRDAFLKSAFWGGSWQDGRASMAMFSLIDRLRELKSQGAAVSIVAEDGFPAQDRDLQMASAILSAASKHPKAALVGLFGNYHTGEIVGIRSDPTHPRLGHRLKELNPLTISIDFDRGWAWACIPVCGIHKMGKWSKKAHTPRFSLVPGEPNGHDAVLTLPSVTAAPPAKFASHEG
jgi:hypothetical protein